MVRVDEPAVYAGSAAGLLVYPWNGGTPRTFDVMVMYGFVPAGNGIHHVGYTAEGAFGLFFSDFVSPPVLVVPFPEGIVTVRGMAGDSKGCIYFLSDNDATGKTWILRYDPATGKVEELLNPPGAVSGAITIDAGDRLYVQDLWPGGTWAYRIPLYGAGALVATPYADNPVGADLLFGSGIAVSPDGKSLFLADFKTSRVYRAEDSDLDGHCSAGEVLQCTAVFNPDPHLSGTPCGITWKGDGLLVNDIEGMALWFMKDLDGDRSFMDAGEQTLFGPGIAIPSNNYGIIAPSAP
jgi:hypothetical protein